MEILPKRESTRVNVQSCPYNEVTMPYTSRIGTPEHCSYWPSSIDNAKDKTWVSV